MVPVAQQLLRRAIYARPVNARYRSCVPERCRNATKSVPADRQKAGRAPGLMHAGSALTKLITVMQARLKKLSPNSLIRSRNPGSKEKNGAPWEGKLGIPNSEEAQ